MKLSKRSCQLIDGRGVCPHLMCCLDAQAIEELLRRCSLLVGLHPDEAIEAFVGMVLALGLLLLVVPCCYVMSRAFPDRRVRDGERVEAYEVL